MAHLGKSDKRIFQPKTKLYEIFPYSVNVTIQIKLQIIIISPGFFLVLLQYVLISLYSDVSTFQSRLTFVVFFKNVDTSLYRDDSTFKPRLIFVVFLQTVDTSLYTDVSTFG